jgi:hypothetical protein
VNEIDIRMQWPTRLFQLPAGSGALSKVIALPNAKQLLW